MRRFSVFTVCVQISTLLGILSQSKEEFSSFEPFEVTEIQSWDINIDEFKFMDWNELINQQPITIRLRNKILIEIRFNRFDDEVWKKIDEASLKM